MSLLKQLLFISLVQLIAQPELLAKDDPKAKERYAVIQRGAKSGDTMSIFLLGACYALGQGVEKNDQTALQWYMKAAELGLPIAQHEVGVYYANGYGAPQNYELSRQWHLRAAEAGFAKSQIIIGNHHHRNEDYEKSFEWYMRAARQGSPDGMEEVAKAYFWGWGRRKDLEKSFTWRLRAAELGQPYSQAVIGDAYRYGWGIPKDEIEAYAWYNIVAARSSNSSERAELEKALTAEARLEGQRRSRELLKRIEARKAQVKEAIGE